MALRALFVFMSFAWAFGEDVTEALASDDVCADGQECSLELHQLRGMKVDYLEALEDASNDEEDEEEAVYVEEEVEGGSCTNANDMKVWKHGGRKSFDASLNHCGRSCAAGYPCTKDCRHVCFGVLRPFVFGFGRTVLVSGGGGFGFDYGCSEARKDCMQKKGYSAGCAGCMAQLVGCSRDHCMNQCTLLAARRGFFVL